MLLPSIFGEDLFDDWMDFPFDDKFDKRLNKELYGRKNPVFGKNAARIMKTDVREKKDGYEVDVDLPGFRKDQIKIELENGYLTVSAEKNETEEEGKETSKYLRKECRVSCQRSYYVGDDVEVESVKAKYDNGMLELTVPKAAPKQIETRSIAIE